MLYAFLLALLGACGAIREEELPLPGSDPHMAYLEGAYWIYHTSPKGGSQVLRAYVSTDLVHWSVRGPLLAMSDIAWADDDGAPEHHLWAPAIAEADSRYFLYYSIGPQGPTPSRIGVAVSNRPGGPFIDSGAPLLTGDDSFEAIDPMVFRDPATGVHYLYAGGSAGSTLRVYELGSNMTELERRINIEQPRYFTEAPFMHFYDGRYYLSYSHGRWKDASYSAHWSVSRSPVGPWAYCGALLSTTDSASGPGHDSFVQDPIDPTRWYFVHHQWPGPGNAASFGRNRRIVIKQVAMQPARTGGACPGLRPPPLAAPR